MKIYTNDLVKGHSDFKVKCLTFGLYTQVSDSGPLGPLVCSVTVLLILYKAYIKLLMHMTSLLFITCCLGLGYRRIES